MPVYVFKCKNNHRTEKFLKIDEPRPLICALCGESLQKVYTPPTIKFIGDGFYINDKDKK